MRTLALVLLMTTTVSGCVSAEGEAAATIKRLAQPIKEHAAALAGDDEALMRSTGRRVIAIYDAGVGPQ